MHPIESGRDPARPRRQTSACGPRPRDPPARGHGASRSRLRQRSGRGTNPVAAAEPTVLGAAATASPSATPTPTPTPTPTADPDVEFSLVAAGDVLPHLPVLSSARSADGGYDFAPVLGPLDPWVQGADLALCHLEVPVTPPGTAPSGYPLFGTPPAIASSLRTQGWDGCSTASNHSVDRGFAGRSRRLSTRWTRRAWARRDGPGPPRPARRESQSAPSNPRSTEWFDAVGRASQPCVRSEDANRRRGKSGYPLSAVPGA